MAPRPLRPAAGGGGGDVAVDTALPAPRSIGASGASGLIEQTLAVAPQEVERGSALGATSGIDNVLEIEVRAGGIFRIGGPGAGGRVTAGAVYADLARLVSGERPILFGGNA